MKRLQRLVAVALLVGLGLGAGNVLAQIYPNKPVRIVVSMVAGGPLDVLARSIGPKLSEVWKQPVLIDNRGGAAGNIGADAVAKAAPDGYTFLINTSAFAISPNIYRKLPFDTLKDFAPVSQLASSFLILVVNSNVPAMTVRELIALAKSQPGRLNYASNGAGTAPHLATELFKLMTGTDIVHVPYKGAAQGEVALRANDVQMAIGPMGGVLPHIKSGELRALAVTSGARLPALPRVPTMVEAGLRDYEFSAWFGLFAPAGTPHEILARLQAEIVRILATPSIRERLLNAGYQAVGSTPEEFDRVYKADIAKYARLAKDVRIPLQD